ncbi:MAG: hypothetical protein K9N48_04900 [Verrucomicrobia bacterium]|nr:hypothetical protein [Verrucomicrobiota bacterium]
MKRILYGLIGFVKRLFLKRHIALDRSRLMSMYLSQANRTSGVPGRMDKTRERKDGKYSYNRERV